MEKTIERDCVGREIKVLESGIIIIKNKVIADNENDFVIAREKEIIIPSKSIIRTNLTLRCVKGGTYYGM